MNVKKSLSKIVTAVFFLLTMAVGVSCSPDSSPNDHSRWTQYGGGPDQSKYFEATEITKENVSRLKMVSCILPKITIFISSARLSWTQQCM